MENNRIRKTLPRILPLLQENIDAVILVSPSNVSYMTGIPHPSGTILLVSKNGEISVSTTVLELDRVRDYLPGEAEVYAYFRSRDEQAKLDVEDARIIDGNFVEAVKFLVGNMNVACDIDTLPYATANKLSHLCKESFTNTMKKIRMQKDRWEIELISQAIKIAEYSFRRTLHEIEEGMTELEIAGLIKYYMNEAGGYEEAFPTIVAIDENSANPHAIPGWRRLSLHSTLLIDWGARYDVYVSDMTRTLVFPSLYGAIQTKYLEWVKEAVEEAIDKVEPGVAAGDIDAAARKTLEKYGVAGRFIHGTGHGVGVDVHEEPYIRPGNNTVLEEGMIFTIEPGIYFKGFSGYRIEVMVEVTSKGHKVLTSLPKILP
ncbi:MAG: aminopeptidase P family protein [Desulfurococcales archaeon]|nr:aminopeptidase P family protein [Desulfurococcales archaeon]